MHNKEVQDLKSLQQDLTKGAQYPGGHFHNPDAPLRSRYPEDYDSTSDYEVRKLGDVVKHLDDHKKQLENIKKSIVETSKESQNKVIA